MENVSVGVMTPTLCQPRGRSWPAQGQDLHVFLDPGARTTYGNWEEMAIEAVRTLRVARVLDPDDAAFTDLIGELSIKSDAFRRLWGRHEVREQSIVRGGTPSTDGFVRCRALSR